MNEDQQDQNPSIYHHDNQGNPVGHSGHDHDIVSESRMAAYWRANLRLLGGLLVVWFLVSFGAGILFADALDHYSFLGFPLGFWFAQQGAIYVFVVLIFVYVMGMQRIDKAFGVEDETVPGETPEGETK
jgi:putative solute:sodium symporter small subunit